MAIRLTPFTLGELCSGSSWDVEDEDQLADQIAAVAVGQSRHVERVLSGAQLGPPPTLASAAVGAISMLTVVDGGDPSHRDGWMFQVMSWIAAHRATPGGLIRPPHMQLADKGFDGLQLEFDNADQIVTAAIIFEDKATSNPRDTIRDEVWPEFSILETGARDNLLTAELIALLQTRMTIDPERAIRNVIWRGVRHYRVSVTVGSTHSSDRGRRRLFQGYDAVATGAVRRRRSEIFVIQDLRPWMSQLAAKALLSVHRIAVANV